MATQLIRLASVKKDMDFYAIPPRHMVLDEAIATVEAIIREANVEDAANEFGGCGVDGRESVEECIVRRLGELGFEVPSYASTIAWDGHYEPEQKAGVRP